MGKVKGAERIKYTHKCTCVRRRVVLLGMPVLRRRISHFHSKPEQWKLCPEYFAIPFHRFLSASPALSFQRKSLVWIACTLRSYNYGILNAYPHISHSTGHLLFILFFIDIQNFLNKIVYVLLYNSYVYVVTISIFTGFRAATIFEYIEEDHRINLYKSNYTWGFSIKINNNSLKMFVYIYY